jgi:ATP-binding protein involved in chromosome partitioning
MAYFVPPDMPEKRYHIFGQDGAKRLASSLGVPFLGELPLIQSIREAGDVGRPAVLQGDSEAAMAVRSVMSKLVEAIEQKKG